MKMRSLCRVASLEVFRFSLVLVVSVGWQTKTPKVVDFDQLSARYFHAASHWWLPIEQRLTQIAMESLQYNTLENCLSMP